MLTAPESLMRYLQIGAGLDVLTTLTFNGLVLCASSTYLSIVPGRTNLLRARSGLSHVATKVHMFRQNAAPLCTAGQATSGKVWAWPTPCMGEVSNCRFSFLHAF